MTLASQAEKAGSTPVICFVRQFREECGFARIGGVSVHTLTFPEEHAPADARLKR